MEMITKKEKSAYQLADEIHMFIFDNPDEYPHGSEGRQLFREVRQKLIKDADTINFLQEKLRRIRDALEMELDDAEN